MEKIGLYVHWPYCARLCPYCDFNIYKNKPDTQADLVQSILADMEYWRGLSGPRTLVSIHFGGGTPSLMSGESLSAIINHARGLWSAADDLEVGLEANPKDINARSLDAWLAAGIERLSVGVQSFDDSALKFLGRDHDGAQGLRALSLAAKIMPRVSADLIYGWAGQSIRGWQDDLAAALEIGAAHISAYQLTIESKTAFARAQNRGDIKAVDVDSSADLYETGLTVLAAARFDQYEVSNYANSPAARSRHNLLYWQGEDYIGIGPGAHGRLVMGGVKHAMIAARRPADYIKSVRDNGHGIAVRETLSSRSWAEEYLLMGMRIMRGISLAHYERISGTALNADAIHMYETQGLLKRQAGRLTARPAGLLVLDSLCHELLLD